MGKSILPVSIAILGVVIIISATFAWYGMTPKPSSEHQAIIDKTTVKAMIHEDLTVVLSARCVETRRQTTHALSIIDLTKRAQWLNQETSFSLWVFEYENHPLAFMKIWGPNAGEIYVEFSRASMTTIECNVVDEQVTFQASTQDPPQSGFWFTWIDITYD